MRLIPSSRIIDEVRKLGAFLGGEQSMKNILIEPIILLCSERSESNLITKIFDAHPKVCAPGAGIYLGYPMSLMLKPSWIRANRQCYY